MKKSTLTKVFSKSSTTPALEDELASKYKEVHGRLAPPPSAQATPPSAVDIMHYYLQRCRSKPYYGSVFFGGQVAKRVNLIQVLLPHLKDRSVVVAINTEGVCILEDTVPRVRATLHSVGRGHSLGGGGGGCGGILPGGVGPCRGGGGGPRGGGGGGACLAITQLVCYLCVRVCRR